MNRSDTSRHPWIDPELRAALQLIPPQLASLGEGLERIPALRALMATTLPTDDQLAMEGALSVRTATTPSFDGHEVELLVLRPSHGRGALPVICFVHPSGMVIPDHRLGLERMADWAVRFDLVVVSVDYRLAPENQPPAAVEDTYAALQWTVGNAASLNIDVDKLMIVGVSGGGGVAAGVTLLARDRGGPAIAHQMLLCPMLDDRAITLSSRFEGVPWDAAANATGWGALLGGAKGGADVSVYAAPARAVDLSNLPPTYVDVGSSEVFRDESIAFASALLAAGVPTELHVFVGGYHGYENAVPTAEVSVATTAARHSYLRRALGSAGSE